MPSTLGMETRTQGDPGPFSTQGCHRRFGIGPGTLWCAARRAPSSTHPETAEPVADLGPRLRLSGPAGLVTGWT
jgi:hypothetical protein